MCMKPSLKGLSGMLDSRSRLSAPYKLSPGAVEHKAGDVGLDGKGVDIVILVGSMELDGNKNYKISRGWSTVSG